MSVIKQTRKVTNVEEITDHICCDFCGALLHVNFAVGERSITPINKLVRTNYYNVTTYHSAWGAESSESYHTFQCCSKCAASVFDAYLRSDREGKAFEVKEESGFIVTDVKEVLDLRLDPNFTLRKPDDFVME